MHGSKLDIPWSAPLTSTRLEPRCCQADRTTSARVPFKIAPKAITKRAQSSEVIIKEWSSQGAVQDDEGKGVVKRQKTLSTDHAIKT